ncbi:MAG: ribosome recycling factor [Bacteroidia bacterium]|nr:ribosome recycling factor [Bacteroidia bacterium]
MDENVSFILDAASESMEAAIDHLNRELAKIRAGKANPAMLDGVVVEYYGANAPLKQVATVSTQDARTLIVNPFDKKSISAVERGIIAANLGLNPSNNGEKIIIPVPIPTEERRRDLVRQAKAEGENAKVSIRNSRRDSNSDLKALKDEGVSEDEIKGGEDAIQKLTNDFGARVDEILKQKEAEILTI